MRAEYPRIFEACLGKFWEYEDSAVPGDIERPPLFFFITGQSGIGKPFAAILSLGLMPAPLLL